MAKKLIAKRYLDEIRDICMGRYCEYNACVSAVIRNKHWTQPSEAKPGGLFAFCTPGGEDTGDSRVFLDVTKRCGCLTQVRAGEAVVLNRKKAPLLQLSTMIRQDARLAADPWDIVPPELGQQRYPLTLAQRRELRKILLPYAEYQTRLRLHFKDIPKAKLKLKRVEVEC